MLYAFDCGYRRDRHGFKRNCYPTKKMASEHFTIEQRGIDITHNDLSQFISQHKTRMSSMM